MLLVDADVSLQVEPEVTSLVAAELLEAAKRVLQYLYSSRELGIKYSRRASVGLHGFSDSDWGAKASLSAYAFLGGDDGDDEGEDDDKDSSSSEGIKGHGNQRGDG